MPWAQAYYWVSGASLLFLLIYRIIISSAAKPGRPIDRRMPANNANPTA